MPIQSSLLHNNIHIAYWNWISCLQPLPIESIDDPVVQACIMLAAGLHLRKERTYAHRPSDLHCGNKYYDPSPGKRGNRS